IFRYSANTKALEALKSRINFTWDTTLKPDLDPHIVGNLLKLYLKELPESLIPTCMTGDFLRFAYCYSTKKLFLTFQKLCQNLPLAYYNSLKYVTHLLADVAQQHSVNKMNSKSLGMAFGSCIFR
ncbi:hypothetical protein HELRODRAFT_135695, partial [Helobdella robusta]|uniref:Rho-GAP domain-containing protein n=1 Tax=Helobdella robusta TaxID=6412 RepID=T1EIA0_HELRO